MPPATSNDTEKGGGSWEWEGNAQARQSLSEHGIEEESLKQNKAQKHIHTH